MTQPLPELVAMHTPDEMVMEPPEAALPSSPSIVTCFLAKLGVLVVML